MSSELSTSREATLVLEGLGHLAQGITIFDSDLRLVAWNHKFLDLYEYPVDLAYVGAPFAAFIDYNARRGEYGEGDIEAQVAQRVAVARTFQPHRFVRTRPDGMVIEVAGNPLPSGGFVSTYTDVSEQAGREAQLKATLEQRTRELFLTEARLTLIADEVPAGIAHIDRDMNILYANKRFARAYQRTPAQVIGKNAWEVLSAETLNESSRYFEQAQRGVQVDFEMRLELPDGQFKDVRTLLRPDSQSSGQVRAFYLVSIDVTRRKATMSALMRSQKMDALGRMASGISHDFNNLLTIILGNLIPLSEQVEDPALAEEFIMPAISAARRGSALTKRLLTLARRDQFDPVPTDIASAVEEICNLLHSSIPATLRVVLEQSETTPMAMVDQSQLEMALLNLSLNARDATQDHGTITIRTSSYDLSAEEAELSRLPPGAFVRIDFTDDGCGMSHELVEKIFEPFFTSKVAGTGSGLGLPMVYGFVRQSNGAIWVDSTLGKGTTFTILLPCATAADAVRSQGRVSQRRAVPVPLTEPAALREGIVLLVEDDQDVRRTIRRKIAEVGFPIIEASSADEAWSLIEQISTVAYVVSDIDMPGEMNGVDLARRIQQAKLDIHVVLMSGKTDELSLSDQLPDVPFLKKPFEASALRESLAIAGSSGVLADGMTP